MVCGCPEPQGRGDQKLGVDRAMAGTSRDNRRGRPASLLPRLQWSLAAATLLGLSIAACSVSVWRTETFESAEGRFRVEVPNGTMETFTQISRVAPFVGATLHSAVNRVAGTLAMGVTWVDAKPGSFAGDDLEAELRKRAATATSGLGGTSTEERLVEHRGLVGLEHHVIAGERHFRYRYFIVGNRFYELLVRGGSSVLSDPLAEVFLGSFELLDP